MNRANRKRRKLDSGDKAVVISSWSSDVLPGTEGVIVGRMPRGYAINIHCWFTDATGKGRDETRCMFFFPTELAPLPPAT